MKSLLMKIIPVLVFTLSLTVAFATDYTNLSHFDELIVSGSLDVQLVEGDETSVSIDEDDGNIEVTVKSGVLKVKRKKLYDYKQYEKPIDVVITYKKLRTIEARAGSEVVTKSALKASQCRLRFSSGAQGRLNLDIDDLQVNVIEGAHLQLKGTTQSQRAKVATGANLDASDLECDRTYIKATTGGEAEVVANKALDANATTGGGIEYSGNPGEVRIKDNFGGDVDRR